MRRSCCCCYRWCCFCSLVLPLLTGILLLIVLIAGVAVVSVATVCSYSYKFINSARSLFGMWLALNAGGVASRERGKKTIGH